MPVAAQGTASDRLCVYSPQRSWQVCTDCTTHYSSTYIIRKPHNMCSTFEALSLSDIETFQKYTEWTKAFITYFLITWNQDYRTQCLCLLRVKSRACVDQIIMAFWIPDPDHTPNIHSCMLWLWHTCLAYWELANINIKAKKSWFHIVKREIFF